MTFHDIWIDPVWSKVIGGLIVILVSSGVGLASRLSGLPKKWWQSPLRKAHGYASDQSADAGVTYPLKYYLEVVNDSRKCVAVRVLDYKPNVVTLQRFVPDTLQLMLNGWWPRPHATDTIALLPNQRCRAWVGVDPKKFTKDELDKLDGSIGTLTLTANGKKIPFAL